MLDQFLDVLGKPFVVPAALIVLGGWVTKLMIGVHDSKRQSRKEFLELWQDIDSMDDIRLEVTARHLVGEYLPAGVIRAIYRMPFPTNLLFDLTCIWPLIAFDPQSGTLGWKKARYETPPRRRWLRIATIAGYLLFASFAVLSFYLTSAAEPTKPVTWLSAANTALFAVIAFGCLSFSEILDAADKKGSALIARINSELITTTPETPAQSIQTGESDDHCG